MQRTSLKRSGRTSAMVIRPWIGNRADVFGRNREIFDTVLNCFVCWGTIAHLLRTDRMLWEWAEVFLWKDPHCFTALPRPSM